MNKTTLFSFLLAASLPLAGLAQNAPLKDMRLEGLNVTAFLDSAGDLQRPARAWPLVSFELDGTRQSTAEPSAWQGRLSLSYVPDSGSTPGITGMLRFRNVSRDTLTLANVVPFGRGPGQVYITGQGDNGLSRSHLFLPGRTPVNVILPDNAWELGFSATPLRDSLQVCALVRRSGAGFSQGSMRRFETLLYPGGTVSYRFYADIAGGPWQQGLRKMFQERYLYDTKQFDDSMFRRADLQWIRHAYVIHLLMAWDGQFYDNQDGQYHLAAFLRRGRQLYGGDDVVGIWPTWPSLGIDQRNQFDLFRDMPGGLAQLRRLADTCHALSSHLFICYNPWDESTRGEGHLSGLADIIRGTRADGVVLDTRGASSRELQAAADSVRSGVVMYTEGMAVPKDMQGIVAGRVHNALYYPPMLNLNKFIKPEFAIFRVTEVAKEPVRREFSVAFFNGYGTEINMFSPGIPDGLEEEYRYLGRTSRILRENSPNFTAKAYVPLWPTLRDSLWVNAWPAGEKTIYTVFSLLPGGYEGNLFRAPRRSGRHWVDLWHHRELKPAAEGNDLLIPVSTEAFNAAWLGSNNEGAVDCVAELPELLHVALRGDQLEVTASRGSEIRIWAGLPAYDKKPLVLAAGRHTVALSSVFGRFEGRFVIQLMDNGLLIDERVREIRPGTPRLISRSDPTALARRPPEGMRAVPAGTFRFHTTHGDDFIAYPSYNEDSVYRMPAFYMDQYPVTNRQFKRFLDATGYRPRDTSRFLLHWTGGRIPQGQEDFPVVYVSYEDAQAYAQWAQKRLPTELEWQYAAQAGSTREWPWDQQVPVQWTTQVITNTLTVRRPVGIDSAVANLGNGKLYPVGSYPKGVNTLGLYDLVGCVWQLTNDVYQSGSYRYVMMKGGSYFNPSSSWWYVQGGPRPLPYRQYLLRVSPGFERNATVGFRCVKDARP